MAGQTSDGTASRVGPLDLPHQAVRPYPRVRSDPTIESGKVDVMTAPVLERPRWTPPAYLNRLMRLMLKTPGLQRLVGKSTVLLTFIGRKTGRSITTPISFVREGDRIILSGHRTRNWWRNVAQNPEVMIRVAGEDRRGHASILEGDEALSAMALILEAQPPVAKMAGVELDDSGKPSPEDVQAVATYTVLVAVDLL